MRVNGIGRTTAIGAWCALMVVAFSILVPRFSYAQDCSRNMLSITGAGSFVSTPDVQSLHLTHGFTIECWAKQNGRSRFPALIDKSSGAASYFGIFFDTASRIFGSIRHSAAQVRLYSPLIDSLNLWHHYAFVFRPLDSLYLYIDSFEVASMSAKGIAGIDSSKDSLRIGASGSGTSFIGSVDEVRIWSVPQTLATVKSTLYRSLGAGDTTLVLCYSFDDEITSTRVHDFSGNGRDGYLQGLYSKIVPSSSPVISPSHGFSLAAKERSIIIPTKRCNPTFDTVINLRNLGVNPILVNSYGFYVGKSFSIIANFPITLPADSTKSYALLLHFAPSAGGVYQDTIYISSADECAGTLRMLVQATYDSVGLQAIPNVLNFGPHTQCQLPEELTTTVYNTSTTDSVTILSQSIPSGSGLQIVTPLPLVVHKNQSAQLVLQLAKGSRGPVSATISVSLDKCSREASVNVLGTRELAEVTVQPSAYLGTFQSSLLGVTKDTMLVVTNDGDVQESILSASVTPPGLMTLLDGRIGTILSPLDTVQIHVRMSASTCGHFAGTLHIKGGLSCVMDTSCAIAMDITPPLLLTAPPLDIGHVCTFRDTTLDVTNPNDYPVQLDTITFAGKVIFFADPAYPFWHTAIPPHQSRAVTVRFYPSQPGDYTDTAFIQMSPCGMGIVILTGTMGFKDLTATPSTLNFGRGCDTQSVLQTATLFNGSTRPVTLVDTAHTGSKRFVVAPITMPFTLQSGQSTAIAVRYIPNLSAKDTGTFAFISADDCQAIAIKFLGSREKASLRWDIADATFDTVCAGSSKVIAIPFTNMGVDTIDVANASVIGAGFTLDSIPKQLGPTGTIRVRFTPTTRSSYTGTLQLVGDNCSTTFTLPLLGSGGPPPSIVLLESLQDFGSILVGDSSEYCIAVTNPSCTAIPLTLAGLAGTPFHFTNVSGPISIARGDTAKVCVTFAPSTHDTSIVNLSFRSDSATTQTLPIHGVGLAADLLFEKRMIDFGYVLRNTPSKKSVYVSNVGNYLANISTSNRLPQYVTQMPASISAESSDSLFVTFTPTAKGLLVDTIAVIWNGHFDTVIVRGVGTDAGLQLSAVGLDFGDVHVGTTASQMLYLTSTNDFPHVDSFRVAFASRDTFAFECDSVLPYQITNPLDTIAVSVSYHAHLEQRDTGMLSIYIDASVVNVPLTARGVEAHPKVNVTEIHFIDVQLGDPNPPFQPVTISMRDTGGYELFVNPIAQDANFSITPAAPSQPILPGGVQSFDITFHPQRARTLTHILQFSTSSPDTVPPILLVGTGVYPAGHGPSFGYSVASETVSAGDHFNIPVSMNGIRLDSIDVDSLRLYLRYDPQMLKFDGVIADSADQSARLIHLTDSTIECILMASNFSDGPIMSLQAEALLGPHPISYILVDSADPSPDIAQSATDGMITVADCFGPVHGVTFAGNYTVNAIHPNPTSDNAQLDYQLGIDGQVTIEMYNAIGQIVRRIDEGVLKQGAHTTTIDMSGLPDGRYVYRLTSLEYHSEGALVILH